MSKRWDQVSESVEFSAPLDISTLKAKLQPGARVLDLGCGYGRITNQLHQFGLSVVGYDVSVKLIGRGRTAFPWLDLKVGEASSIPEPDGSFQAVVVSALFTTVPNAQHRTEIVAEIRRLLSKDGMVCGVDFLRQDTISYEENGLFRSTNGIEMKHFLAEELKALFSGFGDWHAQRVPATSLSGKPAEALQYFTRQIS